MESGRAIQLDEIRYIVKRETKEEFAVGHTVFLNRRRIYGVFREFVGVEMWM